MNFPHIHVRLTVAFELPFEFWGSTLSKKALGKKTYVYIDGFNFYYGCIRKTRYKWLDLVTLSRHLVPGHNVLKVKYFTALVKGLGDPDQPRRQENYWNALTTLYPNQVEIVKGRFHIYPRTYPIAHSIDKRAVPSIGQVKRVLGKPSIVHAELMYYGLGTSARILRPEEKKSDVNLAVHLVNDAWLDRYEAALVVSNDTDLVEAVRVVKNERNKQIIIANPYSGRGIPIPKEFAKLKVDKRSIRSETLGKCPLPNPIPNTTPPITKPPSW